MVWKGPQIWSWTCATHETNHCPSWAIPAQLVLCLQRTQFCLFDFTLKWLYILCFVHTFLSLPLLIMFAQLRPIWGLLSLLLFSRPVVANSVVSNPWTAARQASLSFTISWSLLKLMSIESVMPSNYLILCHRLLFLPSIFPSIRVFSNESVLHIR